VTRFDPSGPLRGSLRPPSDKSISHRAALIAAMGEGETVVEGYLDAADTRSTLAAVRALGAEVTAAGSTFSAIPGESRPSDAGAPAALRIRGVGLRGPRPAQIDVGNAGTLLRLLPGWLAGQDGGSWTLDGDDSIRQRPVDRIAVPLRQMGAQLSCREERLPPLEVEGSPLQAAGADVERHAGEGAGMSAENAPGDRSRGHDDARPTEIVLHPATRLEPGEIAVPADISSAAFFVVAALLVSGSEVTLDDVGINPTRTGLLAILERMGAGVEIEPLGERGGEPTGRLRVRPAPLRGTEVGGAEIPLAIDELPLVALAACFAEGTTTIRDAAELRRKESDRIETVTTALTALGGEVEATEDGMVIAGTGGLRGGAIDSHGDHRIAMLGAVAGLASSEGVEVHGMDAAAVSYPGFESDLVALLNPRA